jgi:hypothetical protein
MFIGYRIWLLNSRESFDINTNLQLLSYAILLQTNWIDTISSTSLASHEVNQLVWNIDYFFNIFIS